MKNLKNLITNLSIFLFLAVMCSPVAAQTGTVNKQRQLQQVEEQKQKHEMQQRDIGMQKNKHDNQKERIEVQRIAFITDKLALSPAEAQVFWPVYNEYDAKRHELSKSFRDGPDDRRKDIDELTNKEAIELADNQLIEAQKMLDLRKEYHARFKNVLPPIKILKLYESEREFQKHLIDRLRDVHEPGQGKGQDYQNKTGNR